MNIPQLSIENLFLFVADGYKYLLWLPPLPSPPLLANTNPKQHHVQNTGSEMYMKLVSNWILLLLLVIAFI